MTGAKFFIVGSPGLLPPTLLKTIISLSSLPCAAPLLHCSSLFVVCCGVKSALSHGGPRSSRSDLEPSSTRCREHCWDRFESKYSAFW